MSAAKRRLSPAAVALLAGAALALLVGAGGYLVLIAPQRADASRLEEEIDATQQLLDSYRRQARQPALPLRVAELFRVTKAMPDAEDMPGVLLELSRVAADSGVAIRSITPQQATPGQGYYRVPVELVSEGSFYDLSDFLYRLRTLVSVRGGELTATGRLFSVDSVQLSEGLEKFPHLQTKVVLGAYVYGNLPPEAAPDSAPTSPSTPAPTTGAGTTPSEPAPPAQEGQTAVGAEN